MNYWNLSVITSLVQQNIVKDNIAGITNYGCYEYSEIVIPFLGARHVQCNSLAINRAWKLKNTDILSLERSVNWAWYLGPGFCFLISLGATPSVTLMRGVFNLPATNIATVYVIGSLIAFLSMFAVFLLLYKLVPKHKNNWKHIWPGALLAAVLFELARILFIFYLENFANYQLIYGSITSIIVLFIWIYYSSSSWFLAQNSTYQYSRMQHSVILGVAPVNKKGKTWDSYWFLGLFSNLVGIRFFLSGV